MLNLVNKEACGIPLLAVVAAELADRLALAMAPRELKADRAVPVIRGNTGKPGTKPACDGALCAMVFSGLGIKPLLYRGELTTVLQE